TLTANTAIAANSKGGGIYNRSTVLINGGSVLSANSAQYGGGLWNSLSAALSSSTLSGNSALFGGGIYEKVFNGYTLQVVNTALSSNVANANGGGIFGGGGTNIRLAGSTVTGNSANNGGGIAGGTGLFVSGSTLAANSAATKGGAIYNTSYALITASSTLSGNQAGSQGGG